MVADETRIERRLAAALARAKTVRGAGIVIAAASTAITVLAGSLMTVLDHDNFPSVGSGLWWAVQTVTTVGYGDHVPTDVAGKVVATFVMLAGIGFLTIITAAITSTFVARSQVEQQGSGPATDPAADELQQINARLERIEAALIRGA
jgi:voltage-gated potassium channel